MNGRYSLPAVNGSHHPSSSTNGAASRLQQARQSQLPNGQASLSTSYIPNGLSADGNNTELSSPYEVQQIRYPQLGPPSADEPPGGLQQTGDLTSPRIQYVQPQDRTQSPPLPIHSRQTLIQTANATVPGQTRQEWQHDAHSPATRVERPSYELPLSPSTTALTGQSGSSIPGPPLIKSPPALSLTPDFTRAYRAFTSEPSDHHHQHQHHHQPGFIHTENNPFRQSPSPINHTSNTVSLSWPSNLGLDRRQGA